MSAIKVNFEIGHEASVRSKKTPEGFTHDWEVFVRGQEGADISHFVDKVVFHLHETFPKPRRVVKDPPFTIKESGYAGFIFPIEIYLKNKDEPKKIRFTYDFTLQQSGFLRDRYIFPNPNEEFKKKLLKGGGILTNNAYYTNPDQESQSRSRDSFTEEKQQLLSKPKLSSENVKKPKAKELKDEVPHRTSSFETLFGPPLQKPPKVSPDPKKLEKNVPPPKPDKKEKERSSSEKKSKHEHKEPKPDKAKLKEEKEKAKQEKIKNYMKEQEKTKDRASKRPSERPTSPDVIKKSRSSPRRPPSPPPRSSSASSMKEEYKVQKHIEPEPRKPKPEEKPPEPKPDKEQKEKKKKEKKSHDRDKERKERKEHRKENHKSKESPVSKEIPKEVLKPRDTPKEKEPMKDTTPVKEKQYKSEKPINKFSLENLQKTPPSVDTEERSSHHKNKDKSDSERKHKHKKKDKKRDESKEKHKESKEKKQKHDKIREIPVEKPEIIEHRETPVQKEPPQELGSPISIDTASQCSSKSGLAKTSHVIDDINSSHSDSESSMIADDDDKPKMIHASPEPVKEPSPEPEPEPEPDVDPEIEPVVEVPATHTKEKSKKHKEKSSKREEKREEKRRKRQAVEEEESEREKRRKRQAVEEEESEREKRRKRQAVEEEESEREKRRKRQAVEDEESEREKRRKRQADEEEESERKVAKTAVIPEPEPAFIEIEQGESSGSVTTETKVQDNGVSSSLGEDAEPGDLSPDYMVQLRDLQQRIMKIKNNEDLERVVNLIAETGRYEVTTQTFDFDLCLLDRSTVQQLIQLVGC